ncbi:MAG: TATA-box-binding protein [Candidatus Diapherotrites archaeon]|nr:TATA-box-binding protein [Candidatus Diapherotrites archaeon]
MDSMGEGGKKRKYNYRIENMVAYANLNTDIDLFNLALNMENVEYEPEQFPGAILRINDPKATLLIFKNGKVICTGTRTEEDVKRALARAVEEIKKAMPHLKLPDPDKIPFKIENIVASASLDVDVDLYALAESMENVEYEPEQFPGVIIHMNGGNPTILLFKNGKLICAGAKSEKEIEEAIEKLEKMLEGFATKRK